jgi:hypothetical protein
MTLSHSRPLAGLAALMFLFAAGCASAPPPAPPPKDPRANEVYLRGSSLLREGRFRDAAAEFQRAAAIEPEAESVQIDLGAASFFAGSCEPAAAAARKAIALNGRHYRSHRNLAHALYCLGQFDQAAAEYEHTWRLIKTDDFMLLQALALQRAGGEHARLADELLATLTSGAGGFVITPYGASLVGSERVERPLRWAAAYLQGKVTAEDAMHGLLVGDPYVRAVGTFVVGAGAIPQGKTDDAKQWLRVLATGHAPNLPAFAMLRLAAVERERLR